jgi:hypothetical protein
MLYDVHGKIEKLTIIGKILPTATVASSSTTIAWTPGE